MTSYRIDPDRRFDTVNNRREPSLDRTFNHTNPNGVEIA
jgi:hypothetical protein